MAAGPNSRYDQWGRIKGTGLFSGPMKSKKKGLSGGGPANPNPVYTVRPELDSGGYRGSTFIPSPGQSYGAPTETDDFSSIAAQILASIEAQGTGSQNAISQWATQDLSPIGKPFDAQIGALNDMGDRARRDTETGATDVRAMYEALAKHLDERNAASQANFGQSQQGLQTIGDNTAAAQAAFAQNMLDRNGQAAQTVAPEQQAALLAELSGPVTQEAQVAGNRASTMAEQYGARNRADQSDSFQSFNNYAANMETEGTNRSAGMYQKLQDYLQDIGNQQAGIGAEKASALSSARNELLSGLSKNATEANNYKVSNQLDLAKLVMENAQNKFGNNLDMLKLQNPSSSNGRDLEARQSDYFNTLMQLMGQGKSEQEAADLIAQFAASQGR